MVTPEWPANASRVAQEVVAGYRQVALDVQLLGHVPNTRAWRPTDYAIGGNRAEQRAQENGLSDTVWADDGKRSPSWDREREVSEHLPRTEMHGQLLNRQDVVRMPHGL